MICAGFVDSFRTKYDDLWLNTVDYRDYNYNPGAANFTDLGENYRLFTDTNPAPGFQPDYFGGANIINLGGADSGVRTLNRNMLTEQNRALTAFSAGSPSHSHRLSRS